MDAFNRRGLKRAVALQAKGPLGARGLARFLGTTRAKGFPDEWRLLSGYGALRSVPLKNLLTLAERVLEKVAPQFGRRTAQCLSY